MNINDILVKGGGSLVVLMTLMQIAPIKVNPWSAIGRLLLRGFRAIGRALNSAVLKELAEVKATQNETRAILDEHIRIDDERDADEHRRRILQFNTELLRDMPHTEEDFIEVLAEIDFYENYCKEHPDYKNNRCVHAIAHIERVYDERLVKHDFL